MPKPKVRLRSTSLSSPMNPDVELDTDDMDLDGWPVAYPEAPVKAIGNVRPIQSINLDHDLIGRPYE